MNNLDIMAYLDVMLTVIMIFMNIIAILGFVCVFGVATLFVIFALKEEFDESDLPPSEDKYTDEYTAYRERERHTELKKQVGDSLLIICCFIDSYHTEEDFISRRSSVR